jgi:nitroreductase/membrane protease YdiL (CAAX protease family)
LEGPAFLRLAIAGEAGLLLLAWAAGRWLGISSVEQLHTTPGAIGVGIVAAVPLLLGLRWTLTTGTKSIRRLVALVVDQLGPLLAPRSPLELALLAALAGIAEEVLFRGVVQVGLARVLPEGGALLVASAVFGLAHFVTPAYAILAGLAGLYLGALFLVQGNLTAPIMAHVVYDVVALNQVAQLYRQQAAYRNDNPNPAGQVQDGTEEIMDAITAINHRTSVRRFRPDQVPREVVARLLDCAVRAPNHKLTEPWRFAVLSGRARDRFAEIRAKHRLKRYSDPSTPEALAGADKVRRESRETPVFIVAMAAVSPDEITREEDYAATMMAIANLMIAAESLSLGTYLKTGGVMRDPELMELAGVPEKFRVVGVISLGYPAEQDPPRRRKPAAELTRWIES